jgi:biopolymer transport protein ExbD
MRYGKKHSQVREGDMTPMIDMTFQLIAFFMVLVNFAAEDQNQLIRLPKSELAKPPDTPPESPITLQVTRHGEVLIGGDQYPEPSMIRPALLREKQLLQARPDASFQKATIIIRADRETKTGDVQQVIKVCQDTGFEKFALRAKARAEAL